MSTHGPIEGPWWSTLLRSHDTSSLNMEVGSFRVSDMESSLDYVSICRLMVLSWVHGDRPFWKVMTCHLRTWNLVGIEFRKWNQVWITSLKVEVGSIRCSDMESSLNYVSICRLMVLLSLENEIMLRLRLDMSTHGPIEGPWWSTLLRSHDTSSLKVEVGSFRCSDMESSLDYVSEHEI